MRRGVPGMVSCIAGAQQVILSEQDALCPLLRQNIKKNFVSSERIDATALSWGLEATTKLQANYPEGFNLILSCDCIYEPLYGQSYLHLADTLNQLCHSSSSTIALVAVERRNQDGVDQFLRYVEAGTELQWTRVRQSQGPGRECIEIYQINSKLA